MAKKKTGQLIGGVAVVAVLGIVYFGVVKYNEYTEQKALDESEAARIYAIQLDEITEITVDNGEVSYTFEKIDEEWTYPADEDFPVNQTILTTLEEHMMKVEATRKFDSPDSLEDYGLDQPTHVVTVTDGLGDTFSLSIGAKADSDYYACVTDDGSVYTIDSTIPSSLNYELYHYLQMDEIPSISSSEMETITLTRSGETQSWNIQTVEVPEETEESGEEETTEEETEADEASSAIEEPAIVADAAAKSEEETTAEPETTDVWFCGDEQLDDEEDSLIDTLASAIASLKFSECADHVGASHLEEFGLDAPQAEVVWTGADEEVILYIGDQMTDESGDNYYYAQLKGSNMVNLIKESLVTAVLEYDAAEEAESE
ncbi:MAG: DUF4340 domain-containing protein [Lachnospiraceae bacterium]